MGKRISHIQLPGAFILFVCAVSLLFAALFFHDAPAEVPARQSSPCTRQTSGVLVILIDSLPRDIMFSDAMPFVNSLRERGAWGTSRVVSVPFSAAGDDAIFSGRVASPLSLTSDFAGRTVDHANVFQRANDAGKTVVITGNRGCLFGMFGAWSAADFSRKKTAPDDRGSAFGNYRPSAVEAYENAMHDLETFEWDFAAIQLLTLDYVGHLATPRSPEYREMCRLLDTQVREIITSAGDPLTCLITSEHGMDGAGFHTDTTDEVMDTGFVLFGPSVEPGGDRRVRQVDWAPTLSAVLGVDPYYTEYAIPAVDLLSLSGGERTCLLSPHTHTAGADIGAIRDAREVHFRNNLSNGTAALILTLLAAAAYVLLAAAGGAAPGLRRSPAGTWRILVTAGVFAIALALSGMVEHVAETLTFSANALMDTWPFVIAAAAGAYAIGVLIAHVGGKREIGPQTAAALLIVFGTLPLLAGNPYNSVNWFLLLAPLVLQPVLKRPIVLAVWGAFVLGLLIRRLTFVESMTGSFDYQRTVFVLCVAVLYAPTLAAVARGKQWKWKRYLPGITGILLPVAAFFTLPTAGLRMLVCLVAFVPVLASDEDVMVVSLGFWLGLFLLVTSGTLNNATHVVMIPLVILLARNKGMNPRLEGLLVGMMVWLFYLVPGNEFNYRYLDFVDPLILSAAVTENIVPTVAVIMGRLLVPFSLLFFASVRKPENGRAVFAHAVLPLLFGIMYRIPAFTGTGGSLSSWSTFRSVAVLAVITTMLFAGHAGARIVAAVRKQAKLLAANTVVPDSTGIDAGHMVPRGV